MTDEDLIGYALDLLDPDERAAIGAELAADPAAAARLEALRTAIAPLELVRAEPALPASLANRTVARLAAMLVEDHHPAAEPATPSSLSPRPRFTDQPESRAVGGRFRLDVFVALGIGLFAIGLVFSFVNRARHSSEVAACQNNLRTLHQGLEGYAETHGGRFPQVGSDEYPTAGSFVQALLDAGQCPPGFHAVCPAAAHAAADRVAYTYPLGHRGPEGVVLGVRRSIDSGDENDLMPISADFPVSSAAPGDGPTSPHPAGHNVLYVGGNVRFATISTVGVNGDDIFRNNFGRVAPGVSRVDAVLGRPADRP